MSDKPVAMLVTAAIVAPICALCVLGPAFLSAWIAGLFGGLGPVAATALAIIGAVLAFGFFRRRQRRSGGDHRGGRDGRHAATTPATTEDVWTGVKQR